MQMNQETHKKNELNKRYPLKVLLVVGQCSLDIDSITLLNISSYSPFTSYGVNTGVELSLVGIQHLIKGL